MTFESLGLSQPILRAVASEGYTTPTPIQLQAIPHVLAGKDLLGCAQTGTGKTAAFALPILHRLTQGGATSGAPAPAAPSSSAGPQASAAKKQGARRVRVLVLSPTRELACQIGDSFKTYGRNTSLRHVVVYGGVGQNPQVQALRHGVDILVATPGRLLDLMQQGHVHLNSVEIFVLDEADRMMDMGFLPDVKRIIAKIPTVRQTLFFSATMPEAVEKLSHAILRHPQHVKIAPVKATAELVEQSVFFVPKDQKTKLLASLIDSRQVTRAIVFTRTKHGADRVTLQLTRTGVKAAAIHGNKSQSARQKTLDSFKANRLQILVATDLAARGLDVDGVSHVFNYDLPEEPETYMHRIGRTGRAGAKGLAIAFCDREERKYLRDIERLLNGKVPVEPQLPEGIRSSEAPVPEGAEQERSGKRPFRQSGGQGGKPHGKKSAAGKTHAKKRPFAGGGGGGTSGGGSSGGSKGGSGRPPKKKRRRSFAL